MVRRKAPEGKIYVVVLYIFAAWIFRCHFIYCFQTINLLLMELLFGHLISGFCQFNIHMTFHLWLIFSYILWGAVV